MSEYTRNLAILLCSLTVLFLSMIAMIACCHDNDHAEEQRQNEANHCGNDRTTGASGIRDQTGKD